MADTSSDNNNSSSASTVSSPSARNRRSSFAGETFANLFGSGRANSISRGSGLNDPSQPTQQFPGAIATAAAQAQRRRLSLTTLGLSGSPNQNSPYGYRRDSTVSANSTSIDESAIDEEGTAGPTPQTPFARRVSFGAKALRDVRTGSGGSGGGGGMIDQNEGFNWSDNLRTRAERNSIASSSSLGQSPTHTRARSIATMEPPIQDMPKPKEQVRPDHFQERILKGDFYMD